MNKNKRSSNPCSLIPRFVEIILSMPACYEASSTIVLLTHNLNGQLFYLPLFHLLLTCLHRDRQEQENENENDGENRNDGNSGEFGWKVGSFNQVKTSAEDEIKNSTVVRTSTETNNTITMDDDEYEHVFGDEYEQDFTLSRLLSLNVIVDLCRLLSRGYSHVYRVYAFIHQSLHPQITQGVEYSKNQADFVPTTLWEYLCLQYRLYEMHSRMDGGGESDESFFYLRYLQALQKVVFLMIVDDYLSVCER